MAKPFTLDLLPGAKAPTTKPGWHKRALAAERRHKLTTAPQRGNPDADAKAVTYALWLAARDGVAVPGDGAVARVDWQSCAHGVRPRAVEWMPEAKAYRPVARSVAQPPVEPLLRIELPHWDYEAPAVVESVVLEWGAPVVVETTREPVTERAEPGPAAHIEPMALCPAAGMPCKLDCGFRSRCGRVAPAAVTESTAEYARGDAPGPVTVLCLPHKAREAVLRRTDARAVPDHGHGAKGGAFRLSLDDARACADLRSVRFVGLPRKPYIRRVLSCSANTTPTRSNWDHPRKLEDMSWRMAHRSNSAMSPQQSH